MGTGRDQVSETAMRVRRDRSEENVADLGTKPLSKTVIAKHCLALGYMNMDEKMFREGGKHWRCSGTFSSAAGDHVQESASRDPQQSQDPQQRQRASGNCSALLRTTTHCSNRLRKVQTERKHTRPSAETTSEPEPNVSVCAELTTNLYRTS